MKDSAGHDPDIQRLLSLLRRAEALERRLGRWAESLSGLIFDLDVFTQDAGAGLRRPKRNAKYVQAFARVIKIRRSPAGALMRMDRGEWIEIPPSLADLLIVLSDDSGNRTDKLVPWKNFPEVIQRLGKDASSRADRHAVIVRIRKLRQILLRHGLDAGLVQTSRQYGVRFAVLSPVKRDAK